MVLGHQGEAQVVAGLCAEQLSGDLQMAEPWDPWSPQHARPRGGDQLGGSAQAEGRWKK